MMDKTDSAKNNYKKLSEFQISIVFNQEKIFLDCALYNQNSRGI